MVQGGFAPIDEEIGSLKPPTLVAPPPLQSQREARRAAMWQRVAGRARVRPLTSVEGEGEDATLTRSVVRSVMDDSRANEPTEMTDEEADAFAQELETELEEQQATEPPPQAPASSSSSSSELSEYELQRLQNIARNRQVLAGLGLESLGPPPTGPNQARDPYPPGRSGAAPTRRSSTVRAARSYAEREGEGESDEDMWEPAEGTSASTGVPPPGAIVINLVSSDEDGPALLSSDPTRRGGLFVAPSTVRIEQGPLTGSKLQEPGLFTTDAIPAGSFVCFYTGAFRSISDFEHLPTDRRDQLSRYAVEVLGGHDVVITPDVKVTSGKVNFKRHPAAAANEPSASKLANAFTQASVVEAYDTDAELSSYLVVCIFTCRPVAAGDEILWNYGEGYDELRQHAGYVAGSACPEDVVDLLVKTLPAQNARVEAILARGGARAQQAVYKLADGSSEDSSGDEWFPVKRVARTTRRV